MDMSSHDHGSMDMGPSCKMKMYWNWYTIDACFLSESWHITSRGMFAGSCFGVIFLMMALELFRRIQREYDRKIVAGLLKKNYSDDAATPESNPLWKKLPLITNNGTFKPSLFQQFIRSIFYAVQLGGAYIAMLLVMYYNGYIFFCLLIGALLGHLVFGTDTMAQENCTKGMGCCE